MFMICLSTKFHVPSSRDSLVIVVNPKAYEKFHTATTFAKNIRPTLTKIAPIPVAKRSKA